MSFIKSQLGERDGKKNIRRDARALLFLCNQIVSEVLRLLSGGKREGE
jgi:hypothetical protein